MEKQEKFLSPTITLGFLPSFFSSVRIVRTTFTYCGRWRGDKNYHRPRFIVSNNK